MAQVHRDEPSRTADSCRATMHDHDVIDEEPKPGDARVFDRLLTAGLSVERIEQHLGARRVYVHGESWPPRPHPHP